MNELENLRFIQRVLEGNPPQADKDAALAMVRDMRRARMQPNIARVLALMRADLSRDLYEGAAANGRDGSGKFWVTHSASEQYEPLTAADVQGLVERGVITQRWPGCYRLTKSAAA